MRTPAAMPMRMAMKQRQRTRPSFLLILLLLSIISGPFAQAKDDDEDLEIIEEDSDAPSKPSSKTASSEFFEKAKEQAKTANQNAYRLAKAKQQFWNHCATYNANKPMSDQTKTTMTKLINGNAALVNITDSTGTTSCLQKATILGNDRLVQLLIERGADTAVVNKDGWPLPHLAAANGQWRVLQIFLNALRQMQQKLQDGTFVTEQQVALVQHLNIAIPAATARGGELEQAKTPFHRACQGRHRRHVETVHWYLADLGLPVDLPVNNGNKDCAALAKARTKQPNQLMMEYLKVFKYDGAEAAAKLLGEEFETTTKTTKETTSTKETTTTTKETTSEKNTHGSEKTKERAHKQKNKEKKETHDEL